MIAASILPNIDFTSSLSSLSSSMNSISSSTFYVSCAEDISQYETGSGESGFVFREEDEDHYHQEDDKVQENGDLTSPDDSYGDKHQGYCDPGHMRLSSTIKEEEQDQEELEDEIQRMREASSVVFSELKFKLRANKSQIKANRGKLKGGDWNLELLKGNWENFVEWRTMLSEDRNKVETTIRHREELLEESDRIRQSSDREHVSPINLRNHKPLCRSDVQQLPFCNHLIATSKPDNEFLLPLGRGIEIPGSKLGKYILPREIPKPYERGGKERSSFRSFTFSKLNNYRNKISKKPSLDMDFKNLDNQFSSTCDDDTLSEISFNASFTTEDYDSGAYCRYITG